MVYLESCRPANITRWNHIKKKQQSSGLRDSALVYNQYALGSSVLQHFGQHQINYRTDILWRRRRGVGCVAALLHMQKLLLSTTNPDCRPHPALVSKDTLFQEMLKCIWCGLWFNSTLHTPMITEHPNLFYFCLSKHVPLITHHRTDTMISSTTQRQRMYYSYLFNQRTHGTKRKSRIDLYSWFNAIVSKYIFVP